MAKPRFEIATPATFITIFANRLRLNAYEDLGRFLVSVSADGEAREQSPVTFDLAKQDAPAFRRAVAAFNAILDEHEAKIVKRNERRSGARQTSAAIPRTSVEAARVDLPKNTRLKAANPASAMTYGRDSTSHAVVIA